MDMQNLRGVTSALPTSRMGIGYLTKGRLMKRKESLPGLGPGSPIVTGGDKFLYRGIGSSRLDCGDKVCHSSRLVLWRGETRTGEVCVWNVCGSMDNKIVDVRQLMKASGYSMRE
ncbi:hypothetical protein EVAR_93259_1 [Eumeta japonica]|uniref:Uncharacterized protein n=1 Tax=Eumeta variegata TaxID=151549 RepID=A0A4C1TXP4_EUMVA|nr:hypothetical protein EVAR_93259_1 [Eumeta japonica]